MPDKIIRVLIVDDSALMRQILQTILGKIPGFNVVGTASNPLIARQMIKDLHPDVITLDIEMPQMDGLSFLEKIMTLRPMPVVMVSSLTQAGADATLRALSMGAVDFISKPSGDIREGMEALSQKLVEKLRMAARTRVRAYQPRKERQALELLPIASSEVVIAIGASTGGVEALGHVLERLPANSPAVIITQHMPAGFTRSFANRLDKICPMKIGEAQEGRRVMPGQVWIAPGDAHLILKRSGADYVCRLSDAAPVNNHRPSVDVMFDSVAKAAGPNAIGVILTGMGRDGAEGLFHMKQAGAKTLGQDEASSLVYGMPKAAFEGGGVEKQVPLEVIASEILKWVAGRSTQAMRI
ncbi:protein-glutamate methylesterase/protein-glutamine glutaminase [Woodsholea maritima]|uniref:protein-glutamate methylesterase/protein-glutamine glutaminase n=1 Tax=Woodsholea maritima TaxID=240237 RepID=UPI00039D3693|nr:chemotaxis-specific protein-glutamate methyltransferase CheB [Woodsholea maritima]